MNKLVVIAEKEEFELIDKLNLEGIPVLVTGVGAINIIITLKDTEIINVGYAECLTGCDFVLESNKKDYLFDMELAYIASLGFERVRAYKYVRNNLDLQEYRSKLNA